MASGRVQGGTTVLRISRRTRTTVAVALCIAATLALTLTATSATAASAVSSSTQPGVTATQIRVSGVASTTNVLSAPWGTSFDGVKAYFDMVNASGGLYGRKLTMVQEHDDQLTKNGDEVTAALAQDNVFALLPVVNPVQFSGRDQVVSENVPTFGWAVTPNWNGAPNLFGSTVGTGGGYVDSTTPTPLMPFLAQQLKAKKIGLLSYSLTASSSDVIQQEFKKWPSAKVVFSDASLSLGDFGAFPTDVAKMKDAGVDLVISAFDTNSTLQLAKEMKKQGLDAPQILVSGYDHPFMAANGTYYNGSMAYIAYAPQETRAPQPAGLKQYLQWTKKGHYAQTTYSMIGWVNAATLVAGLKAAGPNFTRQSVIDAINKMTAFTADGMMPPVDWTTAHDKASPNLCTSTLLIKNGKFTPYLQQPGKPFWCIPASPATLPKAPTSRY
jgi:ABC-type branched-subunit amino acid transport system substrate-binding protein